MGIDDRLIVILSLIVIRRLIVILSGAKDLMLLAMRCHVETVAAPS